MSAAAYYCFDAANLPDELYTPETPAEKWIEQCTTAGEEGFAAGSLGTVEPLDWMTELECCIRIPAYMIANVTPFVMPFAAWFFFGMTGLFTVIALGAALIYWGHLHRPSPEVCRQGQYVYSERNNQKYSSVKYVWPKSCHPPALRDKTIIFCIVPHGVAPLGVCGYPFFSKLWNSRLCRWTAAPVVLKLPVVGRFVKSLGHIEAKAKPILKALQAEDPSNIGIVLDGIAGMFNGGDPLVQKVHLKDRTTVISLALEAGATVIPLYGFGQSAVWTVVTDPWGILEKLSLALQTSVVPFFGRFCLPLGPPRRDVPVTVVFGEPIHCPKVHRAEKNAPVEEKDAYEQTVGKYHQKMLSSFKDAFDKHKAAYGVPAKELVVV